MIGLLSYFAAAGNSCNTANGGSFFGFPHWYEYLPGVLARTDPSNPKSQLVCTPQLNDLANVWLIAAAVIEILLRVAALMAVAFVIYGGISYITSQGDPEATGRAKGTIVNALVGLAIAVMAAAIVQFIAGSVNG